MTRLAMAAASHADAPLDDHVRRFLMESERRVVLHCRRLLDDQNLPAEERRRLMRLHGAAEERLECLVA